MYTTCLFCHGGLGTNEAVEAFPVGRRLAFDAAKGRLWVVCRKCERWNLTPLEERWEAIEQCERMFRDSRLRVSTDNIGLAKLREGLELVRIGEPQRPEFAAWRYGDQFGRRRRHAMIRGGLAAAAVGALSIGAQAAGAGIGLMWAVGGVYRVAVHGSEDSIIAHVPYRGRQLVVRRKHLQASAIVRVPDPAVPFEVVLTHEHGRQRMAGDAALTAARVLLPHANRAGGSRKDVQEAVAMIERLGDVERAMRELPTLHERHADGDRLLGLGYVRRLAIEMALHEEQERRALEGELATLEAMWKEAEEIAGIADGMFVGDGVRAALARVRGRLGG